MLLWWLVLLFTPSQLLWSSLSLLGAILEWLALPTADVRVTCFGGGYVMYGEYYGLFWIPALCFLPGIICLTLMWKVSLELPDWSSGVSLAVLVRSMCYIR